MTRRLAHLAFVAVGIAGSIGVLLGLVSGYFGGWLDNVLMRCMDVLLAFPAILLAVTIMALLGTTTTNVMIATQPPTPTWGSMLSFGREFIREAPGSPSFPASHLPDRPEPQPGRRRAERRARSTTLKELGET